MGLPSVHCPANHQNHDNDKTQFIKYTHIIFEAIVLALPLRNVAEVVCAQHEIKKHSRRLSDIKRYCPFCQSSPCPGAILRDRANV